MDSLLVLLLNIVYGFLWVIAFGVLIGTMLLFAVATWQKALRPLLQRLRGSHHT